MLGGSFNMIIKIESCVKFIASCTSHYYFINFYTGNGNQGDQTEDQGGQVDIPADMEGQEAQAAEFSEDGKKELPKLMMFGIICLDK